MPLNSHRLHRDVAPALPLSSGRHFFVIGAMKAGTSSLYKHLAAHPSIYAPPRKEPRFFSNPTPTQVDVAAYAELFAGRTAESWAFEASTAYTKYPMISGVAERIHAAFPDARLIYLIRDPIERICSAYLHNLAEGRERRSFEKAVLDSSQAYLNVSRYHLQICQYLRVFPRECLLVLLFEEFVADVNGTLNKIAQFLDLAPGFSPVRHAGRYNETSKKRAPGPVLDVLRALSGYRGLPWRVKDWASARLTRSLPSKNDLLDARIHGRLLEELEEDITRLQELLGRDLNCWRLSRLMASPSISQPHYSVRNS